MSISNYTGQCVVVLSAASLQQFIFQSNRLKENIGASYLAKCCLEEDLIKTIQMSEYSISIKEWKTYTDKVSGTSDRIPKPEVPIQQNVDVNLIYVGGGNAALLCKSRDVAKKIVKAWSRKLLNAAPGLRVIVGYGEVKDALATAYRTALEYLTRCEEALPFGATLGSLPVVRNCTSTGLPASRKSREPYEPNQWIAEPASRKRQATDQNDTTNEINSALKEGQKFALQPEKDLGGSEGQSYIAVVYADGNGIGGLLNKVIDEPQDNNKFLHNLRAFSASVSHQSLQALLATLYHFQSVLPQLKDDLAVDTTSVFPIRPIIFGGDDLTFVCDGRLGLYLAAYYLREFTEREIIVLGEPKLVDACAGVAIVPTKFPFAQAYGFADELCGLAKTYRRDEKNSKGSWLDFQIIQAGVTSSIATLRETQYRSLEDGHPLHDRPYEVMKTKAQKPQSWDVFEELLQGFQSDEWPRSRAKGLMQALTQGPAVTAQFIEAAKWRNIELPHYKNMHQSTHDTGWTTLKRTPYFDPLEVLDFYIAIEEKDTDEVEQT